MTEGSLLWALAMTLYIFIAVYYSEEPDLVKLIGPEYEVYMEEVPAYCPLNCFLCFRKRKSSIKSSKNKPYWLKKSI